MQFNFYLPTFSPLLDAHEAIQSLPFQGLDTQKKFLPRFKQQRIEFRGPRFVNPAENSQPLPSVRHRHDFMRFFDLLAAGTK